MWPEALASRFLGIIGRDPSVLWVQPVTCCHLLVFSFLCWFEIYSIRFCKMMCVCVCFNFFQRCRELSVGYFSRRFRPLDWIGNCLIQLWVLNHKDYHFKFLNFWSLQNIDLLNVVCCHFFPPSSNHSEKNSSLRANVLEELCTSQTILSPSQIWFGSIIDTALSKISSWKVEMMIRRTLYLCSSELETGWWVVVVTFPMLSTFVLLSRIYISDIFHVLPKSFLEQNHLDFVALHDVGARALLFHGLRNFYSHGIHF